MKLLLKIALGVISALIIFWVMSIMVGINIQAMTETALKRINNQTNPSTPLTTYVQAIKNQNPFKDKPKWIPGKSLKECMGSSKEINEQTIKCRKGYWINKKINYSEITRLKKEKIKQQAVNQATRTCQYWNKLLREENTKETRKNQNEACKLRYELMKAPANEF